jgi:3-dehydroquinate dehydratase II
LSQPGPAAGLEETTMAHRILILNGPGLADPGEYDGDSNRGLTLAKIRDECMRLCHSLGMEADFRQTDDIPEIFEWLAKDSKAFDGVIINPVGYSGAATGIFPAFRSANEMKALLDKPVVEVHTENIFSHGMENTQPVDEPPAHMGFICGLGVHSYLLGIRAIAHRLESDKAAW